MSDAAHALKAKFQERFGRAARVFQAPGRVNVIGEHTDYNDGFVLPFAIDWATRVAISPRTDRRVEMVSETLQVEASFNFDEPARAPIAGWSGYVEGMGRLLEALGLRFPGASLLIESDLPIGAGLSSSAALELASGLAFLSLVENKVPRTQLAQVAQQVEHRFVGTQCGLMDQWICALGKAGQALLIDCRSMQSQLVPLNVGDAAWVVCDTGVKHNLASSEYNRRREQCQTALQILARRTPGLKSLREVSLPQLKASRAELSEILHGRVHHVVSENMRTLDAVKAVSSGDLAHLGKLMLQSHRSLRNDYQVSCRELDAAVAAAQSVPGVWGSRMTGGGFGGSTLSLVERSALPQFEEALLDRFEEADFEEPTLREVVPSDGARELV